MAEPAYVDEDALLAALVLAPGVFPRNRFPHLYRHPRMIEVRRRARELRGFAHLAAGGRGELEIVAREELDEGGEAIAYRIPRLRLEGRMTLSPFERDVMSMALSRVRKEPVADETRGRVMLALSMLMDRKAAAISGL